MRLFPILAAVAGLSLLAAPAGAQRATPSAPSPAAAPRPAPAVSERLNRTDVEAWFDGFLPPALANADIAGAVVVVVKDGQVMFEKGYGYSDVAHRTPVDPERTLFRVGSVSKLFAWTAVMQQVEAGKIDLDADINRYLDFKIPAREGKPVTMRELMTHAAGFEQPLKNLFITTGPIPLDAYLKTWIPERIFAPGEVPAYSNYGAALAAYIVQRVSGEPFDDYADRHILGPLQMRDASFRQPLPAALRARLSLGYNRASEPPKPFENIGPAPAGSLSATGADMAHFMIAHLQDGTYDGASILKPATARMMHDTPTTIIPHLDRMLLGFYETDRNGHRAIAHGGDTQQFHTDMRLYVDDGVGVFISLNSAGKDYAHYFLRNAVGDQFADRYLPPRTAPAPETFVDAATAAAHAHRIAGIYESSRRSGSNFMTLAGLLSQVKASVNPDGTVSVSEFMDASLTPKKWREVSPYVWRNVAGQDHMAAKVEGGRIVMISADEVSPAVEFLPIPAWRSPTWMTPAVGLSLLALLLTALSWPVIAVVRRSQGARFQLDGVQARAHRTSRIAAVAVTVAFLAWFGLIMNLGKPLFPITDRLDPLLWALHIGSLIVFPLGAAAMAWSAWIAWSTRRGWTARLWTSLLALACLVILYAALVFKLIAFNTHF